MRLPLIPLIAGLTIAAADKVNEPPVDAAAPTQAASTAKPEGPIVAQRRAPSDMERTKCRDSISPAIKQWGKPPMLEREPASPERPLAIYAVDRRENRCSVMVMMGNPADIRPVPEGAESPIAIIPPKAGNQAKPAVSPQSGE
jgi:hypothetical protein